MYDISLSDHSLLSSLRSDTIVLKNIKYPNDIEEKQWKTSEKEVINKGMKTSDVMEVVPLGQ